MIDKKTYNRELQKYNNIPFNEFDSFMVEFMNWLITKNREPFEEWIKDVCHESYLTKDIPEEYLKNLSERNIYHQIKEIIGE
jgi:hypothetical protein